MSNQISSIVNINAERFRECFNINSLYCKKMLDLINAAIKAELTPSDNHVHHIIPRSYFKKKKIPVDNSSDNLIALTPAEHFMVHYYAWKCSTKEMKLSLAYAFHLMYNMAGNNITEDNIFNLSLMFQEVSRIKKDLRFSLETLNERYKDTTWNIIKASKNYITFKCKKCGTEKKLKKCSNYINLSQIPSCDICRLNKLSTNKFALIFVIGIDKKAYWKCIDISSAMDKGYISLTHAKKYAFQEFKTDRILKQSFIGLLKNRPVKDGREFENTHYTEIPKKMCENWAYFYNEGNLIPFKYSSESIKRACKIYGIKIIDRKTFIEKKYLYFIEEFPQYDYRTSKEWEEILGCSWGVINKNFTVLKNDVHWSELLDYYKKDKTIIDKLKDTLEYMHKFEFNKKENEIDLFLGSTKNKYKQLDLFGE